MQVSFGRAVTGNLRAPALPLLAAGVLLLAVTAACTTRLDLVGVDNPEVPATAVPGASRQKMFLMTTRAAAEELRVFYSDRRAPELGLASVVVSIPPNHVTGELEAPNRLPPDPRSEFAIVEPGVYTDERAFIKDVNRELAKRAPIDRDILFFVHGYNNSTSEALLRMGQFVEDSGFQGVPILFSWASGATAAKYVYDINSALVARSQLKPTFDLLSRTSVKEIDIFGHSMGAFLVMEGVVQADLAGRFNRSGRLGAIVLASPDIDIDLFNAQLSQVETDFSRLFVLLSKDDNILRLSRILSGGVDRVGASDAEAISQTGAIIIDLSEVDDSAAGSHTKFAGSPEVVQLIGRGLETAKLNPSLPPAAGLADLVVGSTIAVVYD